jgi:hypothetical protein
VQRQQRIPKTKIPLGAGFRTAGFASLAQLPRFAATYAANVTLANFRWVPFS